MKYINNSEEKCRSLSFQRNLTAPLTMTNDTELSPATPKIIDSIVRNIRRSTNCMDRGRIECKDCASSSIDKFYVRSTIHAEEGTYSYGNNATTYQTSWIKCCILIWLITNKIVVCWKQCTKMMIINPTHGNIPVSSVIAKTNQAQQMQLLFGIEKNSFVKNITVKVSDGKITLCSLWICQIEEELVLYNLA